MPWKSVMATSRQTESEMPAFAVLELCGVEISGFPNVGNRSWLKCFFLCSLCLFVGLEWQN